MPHPETTPYDDDRRAYSREALARLVLSQAAYGIAGSAGELVITRHDAYCGPGGRVSEAAQLVASAERTLVRAVVYERERGSSWEEIARYFGVGADEAEERFSPELTRWETAFDVPYRLDETGRKRIPQLPTAAYDPATACRQLDLWAHLRTTIRDRHAVSAGLRMTAIAPADGNGPEAEVSDPETESDEMRGWIWRPHLRSFLELLARYNSMWFDETDWETVSIGLETTDDETPDAWYSYPLDSSLHSLNVRLANTRGGNEVSVALTGATSADLRLRIDTLMDAFAARP
ncbi:MULTISPECIES: hypothetical protein [unclassified Streptomyces]|uniref:hypothetical protein n=1 Tax=unclassified Streptomyces TaxID=2593676 RepID=UPI002E8175D6|nr:hypothetical protein [Streptomyces sp. NBC_00589]WTI39341.1 hypothetical protein OIC96_32410 [Streptomyces sp. NBC_00775]WUB26980.1 hypothetical protein OHA51_17320 [Streptomyces sp. NBC_00589]